MSTMWVAGARISLAGRWCRGSGLAGVLFVGFSACPVGAAGQSARPNVEEGNRLYSEGRFDEAHRKYLEALLDDPGSPLILFNDGSALYRDQDFQEAQRRFQEALEDGDPALRSAAWYNLGNTLYRQQQLQESLEAYKEALRANPSDTDAKHNLERVLEQLQKQKQQNQQPQQGKGEDQAPEPQANQGQEDRAGNETPERQPPSSGSETPPQGESNPQERPEGAEPSPGAEEQEAGEQPQAQPGEMTQEEAQRLLSAIREDPGEVNRKRVAPTGKRPRKDW
ncbi:MAG: tetratricopeptide repeat protein [Gemmatimonadota bacterium]